MVAPLNDDVLVGLVPPAPRLTVEPLLDAIGDQADDADRTRHVAPAVIAAIKTSDLMRMSAAPEIGGVGSSIMSIGRELEAIAARCASTAWVLWNHLAVFHLFAGALGPSQHGALAEIVRRREWVCFPGGAGSGVRGTEDGDGFRLDGRGAFGSGSRYADWAGVAFAVADADGARREPLDLRFTVVRLDEPTVDVDPTWDGASLRASATDDVHYRATRVPAERCVRWFGANRAEALRDIPVVAHRYREDWVGLSDVWLVWMGVGVVGAALDEACRELRDRRAIMGKAMSTRPTVQVNLGRAAALVAAAAAIAHRSCQEIDDRIEAELVPSESDYLRQMALSTAALDQLGEAMTLLQRTLGGNGLREGGRFERRFRDFQAMPLHINAHVDRVTHQLGRHVLDEPLEAF